MKGHSFRPLLAIHASPLYLVWRNLTFFKCASQRQIFCRNLTSSPRKKHSYAACQKKFCLV